MRKLQANLLAGAVALAVPAPGTAPRSSRTSIFFGDSLTDAGSYKPVLPPGTGLVHDESRARSGRSCSRSQLGFSRHARESGRHRLRARRRARDRPARRSRDRRRPRPRVPIATQISQFLAKGPADPNAIYSVRAARNDIFFQLGLAAGRHDHAGAGAGRRRRSPRRSSPAQIAALHAGGAQYIVVFNVPDIGKTPFGWRGTGQAAQITALSSFFNTTLFARSMPRASRRSASTRSPC